MFARFRAEKDKAREENPTEGCRSATQYFDDYKTSKKINLCVSEYAKVL